MKKPETSLPEQYFTDVYNASSDPWNFETSDYEYEKYTATVDALPKAEYDSAFEIGCSIGVLTGMLVKKCKKLLSVDVAEAPLTKARVRLKDSPQVVFKKMAVPDQFPSAKFDLIVMSEVGYYLAWPDFKLLRKKVTKQLSAGGQLLLVHWTPVVHDYPLTGDEVHDAFMEISGETNTFKHLLHKSEATYRLDLFEKN